MEYRIAESEVHYSLICASSPTTKLSAFNNKALVVLNTDGQGFCFNISSPMLASDTSGNGEETFCKVGEPQVRLAYRRCSGDGPEATGPRTWTKSQGKGSRQILVDKDKDKRGLKPVSLPGAPGMALNISPINPAPEQS
jgi:hypothetical protein